MTLQAPIRTIVIVGGGVTGWAAAAGIANSLRNKNVSVVLLDIPMSEASACPQSTLPQTLAFHRHLGIDERDIMRAADGAFRLGTEYCGLPAACRGQLRPFGSAGASIGFILFHHFATKLRHNGGDIALNDYSVTAAAARLGTFSHPDEESPSLLSRLAYGLNLDSTGYTSLLRRYAEQLGVTAMSGETGEVALRDNDGSIEAVTFTDGRRIEADLFIDCSGERGLLIEVALQSGYEDWSQWLPCDRAVGIRSTTTGDVATVVRCSASDAGWIVQTPLRTTTSTQYIFSSRHLDNDQALDALRTFPDATDNVDTWQYSIRNGHRRKFWIKNCIALGAAAGAFEALEMTGLHLLQSGLTRLLGMLPDAACHASIAAEYNRVTGQEYAHIRDYLAFNYVVASGRQTPFWQERRSVAAPDSLTHKLQLFESHGRFTNFDHETFSRENWASLFINGGRWPQHYDPLLDRVDAEKSRQHFSKMRDSIHETALRLPAHGQYIDNFCGKGD